MKKMLLAAAAAFAIGICAAAFQPAVALADDMSKSGDQMNSDDKMGGDKMGGDKTGDDKMGDDKMGGDKMGGDKMKVDCTMKENADNDACKKMENK